MNIKDERIAKLFRRGLTVLQIARKIGQPDANGAARVLDGLKRTGLLDEEKLDES